MNISEIGNEAINKSALQTLIYQALPPRRSFSNNYTLTQKYEKQCQTLEYFVKTHTNELTAYVKTLLHKDYDTIDIIDNIFLGLWRNMTSIIAQGQTVKSYLYVQARQLSFVASRNFHSDDRIHQKHLIKALSFSELSTLHLVLVSGLSYEDVAKIENISVDSAKQIFLDSKNKMKNV